MDFSLFALPTFYRESDGPVDAYYRRLIDLLVSAEELGYDAIWANEHHFHPYGGLVPAPAVLLSAIAQRTKRMRLGTSVVVLPLHNPIEIAEQLAMVDNMSGGRVDLGVGRGFVPFDYQTMNIPMSEGQERTLESLEVIVKAWSGGPFTHHGKFFHYENLEIWPPAVQRPHPPVWIACSGTPESFAFAGRSGYNLLTVSSLRPVEVIGENARHYHDAWLAAGHDPAGYKYNTHYQIVLDEDRAKARKLAAEAIQRYAKLLGESTALFTRGGEGRPLGPQWVEFDIDQWVDEGRILAGTPDDAIAILKRAQKELRITGIDGTFLFGGLPFETAERSLRMFADEVIPALRDAKPEIAAPTAR